MNFTINRVAIVGGTHGNEYTGVYLSKHWQNNPNILKRNGFTTEVHVGNEKAFQACRRYIDRDLNRSCKVSDMEDSYRTLHEDVIAKNLNALIGPKGQDDQNADFVIDLHTTTANMGKSIVVSCENRLTWFVIAELVKKFPDLKIYRWLGDEEDAYVNSLGSDGFAIEVGPIPQGVLRADIYNQTNDLVQAALNILEMIKSSEVSYISQEIEIYDHVALVDFPRDENNNITAMVHEKRQDMDFKEIKVGDPLFMSLDGKTIEYERFEPLYGIFINEAAYYEKKFALCLAKKVRITI